MPIVKFDSSRGYNDSLAAVNMPVVCASGGIIAQPFRDKPDAFYSGSYANVSGRFRNGPQTSWEGLSTYPSGVGI